MNTDPIADMIIRIKNGSMASKDSVMVPYSKIKHAIAEVLLTEGYIRSIAKKKIKNAKFLDLGIAQNESGSPVLDNIVRVSKPSKRIYLGVKDIRPIRYGYGSVLLSTPKGILTDKQAKKEHVGGEVLLHVW